MVQPQHNFATYLHIETKFMTRNKTFFYRFIYFSKSFGRMPITNPFILTVKAGRKLAISQREKISRKCDCIGRNFESSFTISM